MNRRTLLGAAAATLAVPAAASAAPNADAALLATCAEFRRLDAVLARWNAGEIGYAEGDAANEAWWDAFHKVTDTAAITPAGVRVKAQVLALSIPRLFCPESVGDEHRLALSLVRDIAGAG